MVLVVAAVDDDDETEKHDTNTSNSSTEAALVKPLQCEMSSTLDQQHQAAATCDDNDNDNDHDHGDAADCCADAAGLLLCVSTATMTKRNNQADSFSAPQSKSKSKSKYQSISPSECACACAEPFPLERADLKLKAAERTNKTRHIEEEMASLRKRMDLLRNGGDEQQQQEMEADVTKSGPVQSSARGDAIIETSTTGTNKLEKMKSEMNARLRETEKKMEQQQKFSSSKHYFQMEDLRKKNDAESKQLQAQHAQKIQDLEQKMKAREKEFELQIDTLKNVENNHTEEMVRKACAEKLAELEQLHAMELEKRLAEKDDELQKRLTTNTIEITSSVTGNVTLAMSQRINAAEELAKKRSKELEELRADANAEIDEVLNSLDRVEAEYNGRLTEVQSSLDKKEIAYSGASAQLAESMAAMQQTEAKCRRLEMEAHSNNAAIVSFRLDLKKAQEDQSRAVEEERASRIDAVEAAKSEMRAAAEQQFAEANRHFLNLKREYEFSINEIKVLKVEKQRADTTALQANRKEAQMLSEIAQLKAEIATLDAKVAKQAHEMIMLGSNDRGEEYRAECESVRKSLGLVEAEKERLVKENQELSAVCEELMSLVEGNDAG